MSQKKIFKTAVVISIVFIWIISTYLSTNVYAASDYEFVVLNTYQKTLKIGDEFYLSAATSTGKKPVFSSIIQPLHRSIPMEGSKQKKPEQL